MCGLAGIISDQKTEFNVNHFNVLGTLNDERGGDSCGIFIDGQIEYGIGKTELFRSYTTQAKYPKSASIALVHCRKASAGYPVCINQAQPVVIKNNGKTDFVLMHNGTIININTLSKKYLPGEPIIGLSDSQILAKIIYQHGYEVLEEYTGCAVLIIVDYRSGSPKVLIFKGSSCYNEGKSNSERPLYYMVNEGKFYFSSIYSSLYCINNKKTIYNFPVNQLYTIKHNALHLVKNINRSKLSKTIYQLSKYSDSNYNEGLSYNYALNLYMVQGKPAHGEYVAFPSGYLVHKSSVLSTDRTFYFFCGKLLYGKECWELLNDMDNLFEDNTIMTYAPEIIDYFSYGPQLNSGCLTTVDENFQYQRYLDGSYVILFNNGDRITVKGGITTKTYIYPVDAVNEFDNVCKSISFDFNELEHSVLHFITERINQYGEV